MWCYLSLSRFFFSLGFSCPFIASSILTLLLPVSCSQSAYPSFPHYPPTPPPVPGCLFQGWWLWLESRHRWQASLPSGEGFHSLNFLHFSSFLLLSSSAQTFGLQLFTSGKPLSQRAWCEGKGRVLQGGGLSQTHELSSDQLGHQY